MASDTGPGQIDEGKPGGVLLSDLLGDDLWRCRVKWEADEGPGVGLSISASLAGAGAADISYEINVCLVLWLVNLPLIAALSAVSFIIVPMYSSPWLVFDTSRCLWFLHIIWPVWAYSE